VHASFGHHVLQMPHKALACTVAQTLLAGEGRAAAAPAQPRPPGKSFVTSPAIPADPIRESAKLVHGRAQRENDVQTSSGALCKALSPNLSGANNWPVTVFNVQKVGSGLRRVGIAVFDVVCVSSGCGTRCGRLRLLTGNEVVV
jgi:hypothetical protein